MKKLLSFLPVLMLIFAAPFATADQLPDKANTTPFLDVVVDASTVDYQSLVETNAQLKTELDLVKFERDNLAEENEFYRLNSADESKLLIDNENLRLNLREVTAMRNSAFDVIATMGDHVHSASCDMVASNATNELLTL